MAGVELDLDLGPVEIMAGLKAELSTLNRHHAQDAERRKRELQRTRVPVQVRMVASATIPTPTARTGINLGGPDAGFFWLLRRLIIGGVTWKTAAAGTAEIYVTALTAGQGSAATGPVVSGLALSDMADQSASLPSKAFYSNQQVIVQAQENLVVVIDTGTVGQVYVATAQFEVWRTVTGDISFDTA
jgi:hypothetical protein